MSKVTENVVFMDRGNYTTCTVHLHGGTILSYRVRNQEMFYLKKMTVFNSISAVRGGIKFVFPYFGRRINGPKHGFSRCVSWILEEGPTKNADGNVEAVFSMSDSDYTKAIWNYQFKVSYKLVLFVDKLTIDVKVENTSKYFPFSFTIMRHSIFRVEDVNECEIHGLTDCKYIRLNRGSKEPVEQEPGLDTLRITRSFLDVFPEVPNQVEVTGIGRNNWKLRISTFNAPDVLIYNPWVECTTGLDDSLHYPGEYLYCVGVGHGRLSEELRLEPGECWESHHLIEVLDEKHENRMNELAALLDNPLSLFKDTCIKTDLYSDPAK